ncbi:MAG: MarR family transcriptional regulator [Gammaproteobacteria bacterium]|nr:MarR family transcriptional regulator [Gammaproteobacteria bacterium]
MGESPLRGARLASCATSSTGGFPPTLKELADILGISGPSVRDQVNQLVRKGYVNRESRKARGLTVLRVPPDEVPVLHLSEP